MFERSPNQAFGRWIHSGVRRTLESHGKFFHVCKWSIDSRNS